MLFFKGNKAKLPGSTGAKKTEHLIFVADEIT